MEIKVNERIPSWLSELVAEYNLQLTSLSKYCRSIQAIQNASAGGWRNLTAEWSHDVLASSSAVFRELETKAEIGR